LVWKLFQSLRKRMLTQFPSLTQTLLKKQAQTKLGLTILTKLRKTSKQHCASTQSMLSSLSFSEKWSFPSLEDCLQVF